MSKKTIPAFRQVIEAHGILEEKLSKPIKKCITAYKTVEAGIASYEKEIEETGALNEEDQTMYDDMIADLEEKDHDLVTRINTWQSNAESNKIKGEAMAKGRQAKKNLEAGLNEDGSPKTTPSPIPAAPVLHTYGFYVDLTQSENLQSAISFESELAYDHAVSELQKANPDFEVGIKQPSGEVITDTFANFKKNFFPVKQPTPATPPAPGPKLGDDGYTPVEEIPADDEKKKKNNNGTIVGVVVGLVVVGILAALGIKRMKND